MKWTELDFGRYQGKTLPQVLFTDPDWFFWAVEEGAFRSKPGLVEEAELLARRAKRVRIPERLGDVVAQYWVDPLSCRFARVEVVPRAEAASDEEGLLLRARVFDLSAPRRLAPYDKSGGRKLIGALKALVFGGTSVKMTRARAEAFFADPDNFADR